MGAEHNAREPAAHPEFARLSPTPEDAFLAAARAHGERPAVIGDAGRWTHGQLERAVDRAAAALRAAGARAGERVVLRLDKGLAVWLAHRACLRLGAVSVPTNPRATDDELRRLFADARPVLVVSDAELPTGSPPSLHVDTDDDFAHAAPLATAHRHVARPDELACLVYTSGTTGRPKGARLTHGNLAANTADLLELWAWSARDVLLHVLPLFHVHGLFVGAHAAASAGACLLLRRGFDPADVWARLGAGEATLFFGVPTHYHRLLQARPDRVDLTAVRLLVSGSAPLRPDVKQAFAEATGHVILERYGMTELGMVTSQRPDARRPAGAVGRALPGVDLRVVEPGTDVERPRGEVGEVVVRGPSVCDGYWERPQASAAALTPDGWFRTGDLGHLDAHDELWLSGRAKELIISGGFNVYPREVEAVLEAQPGVAESAVAGLPDDDLGEVVVAAVVARPGARLDEQALRDACREQLAAYKLPRRVRVVDELPRNAMGKVQKARVTALFA